MLSLYLSPHLRLLLLSRLHQLQRKYLLLALLLWRPPLLLCQSFLWLLWFLWFPWLLPSPPCKSS